MTLSARLLTHLVLVAAMITSTQGMAEAKAEKTKLVTPKVYVKVSSTKVNVGKTVKVYGSVTAKSQGADVWLQRYYSGAWHTLIKSKVTSKRTFSFTTKVTATSNSYRAAVLKAKYINKRASSVVRVTGVLPPPPPPPPSEEELALADVRAAILQKTNEARANEGDLDPLVVNSSLATVAQNWAVNVASSDEVGHNANLGSQTSSICEASSENVATATDVDTVVNDWLADGEASSNILGEDNTRTGIGYSVAESGNLYFVQVFCKLLPPPPPPASELDQARAVILQKMNEARAANGDLPPLSADSTLAAYSQAWTTKMANEDNFRHSDANFGAKYPHAFDGCSGASEIIAAGQGINGVVMAWMGSPAHRAAILDTYNRVGIGYVYKSGTEYGSYFTAVLCYKSS